MKAIWNGAVLADSDDTLVVEGNHYFPRDSIRCEFFEESEHSSHCPWKGDANYFSLAVAGQRNENAAWYYDHPREGAAQIAGRVAFWRGVVVEE